MSSEDETIVGTARRIIESITPARIFDNTFALALLNTEGEYNIKHNRGFYRFNLYIYLSFWFLYSGKLAKNDRYINVDEGQDISICEYKVFNQVNGGKVVFNIYGDTNQLIKTGRGIHDWGQLLDLITADVFMLNENYRNTREITDYCNRKLDFNSISIGITGEKVRHIQQTEAVIELKKYLNVKLKKRTAIIVNSLLNTAVDNLLDIEGFSHNSIKDGAVSILAVEHAKGLEFDTVYVIPDRMNKNEKYIAFTRALSELIIVEG